MNLGPDDLERYLATAEAMLSTEGMADAAKVLRIAKARVEETGYDNWNGGTTSWTIYLQLEPTAYARLGGKREGLENQITKRLASALAQFSSDSYTALIAPTVETRADWRLSDEEVSRATRQSIADTLRIGNVPWYGQLGDVEFLERLFDLEQLPSNDYRFQNAADDIWQHRVNNPNDWPDDWIFGDGRFDLMKGSSANFLRFICEVIHPAVRPDRNEALKLAQKFNEILRPSGWNLIEEETVAGHPRFVPRRSQPGSGGRSLSRAKTVADALDAGWMQKEIERLEAAVERDPTLAIGTAKDLVETCCKTILKKRGIAVSPKADLPKLTKLLAKELNLVPEGISDEAKGAETIRLILRNLAALTQYLAELRGLYGSGHGRDGHHRGLEPRHARLAVGSAVAFIDFVTATHYQRPPRAKRSE